MSSSALLLRLGAAVMAVFAVLALGVFGPKAAEAQIEPQPHRDEAERAPQEEAEPVLTKMPELLVYVDPDYPDEARLEGVEGEVILLLTISAEGVVTKAEVVDSPDTRLSRCAKEAARALEFSPAEIDHEPAPVQIEFGYVFALDAASLPDGSSEESTSDRGRDEPERDEPRSDEMVEPTAGAEDGEDEHEQDSEPLREDPAEIAPEPNLSGRALTRGLREPIDGAMVISGEDVVTTDSEGYFELWLKPGETHSIEVRAPGYHSFSTSENIRPDEKHEVVYYVQRRSRSPYETVVRARRPRKEVSRVVLSRDETERVPGTFGDPLRVIENLPGMGRSSFIGGQLLVRGSRPEDSGVYFDGVGIPMLYHFGGLTSVVNSELIEDIQFFPGGFGAEYGRASAGIVDVTPRRLIGKPARGSAKIDLMDTSLFYRRPLGESAAVGLAVRRSYVDVFLPLFLRAATTGDGELGRVTATPVYLDYQLKLDWSPSEAHELEVFFFGSRDTLDLLTSGGEQVHGFELDMRLSFQRLMLAHTWRLRPGLELRSRPYVGGTFQGAGGGEMDGAFEADLALGLFEIGLRQDLRLRAREGLALRFGLDALAFRGTGEIEAPIPSDLLAFPSPIQPLQDNQSFDETDYAAALALWTEAVAEPTSRLQLVPGLRFEVYRLPEADRPVLEPRLSARYALLDDTTLKAAAGIYHNAPTIIEANPVIGNPAIRPERARHLVVGLERELTDVIDLDLQLFHNRHTDLIVSSSEQAVEGGQAAGEAYVNRGDGRAYGAEFLVRHNMTSRAFGWLSYTIMRSERRSSPDREYLVTASDQTHIMTLVGSYRLGRGFELGARFRLASGNPYTPVIGSTHDLDRDTWRPIRGPTRSERLPAFHQLDLRAEYTRIFDTFTISAFMDLMNAYNRANVESFQYDYRYRERVDFNGLPLIPVLGVRGQW